MSVKIVCSDCELELIPVQSGVNVIEYYSPDGPRAAPRPYKLWHADEFECPHCHRKVVAGFAEKPLHPYSDDFAATFASFTAQPEALRHDYQSLSERMRDGHPVEVQYPQPLPAFPVMAFAYIMRNATIAEYDIGGDMLQAVMQVAGDFVGAVAQDESDEIIAAFAGVLGNSIVRVLDAHKVLGEAKL